MLKDSNAKLVLTTFEIVVRLTETTVHVTMCDQTLAQLNPLGSEQGTVTASVIGRPCRIYAPTSWTVHYRLFRLEPWASSTFRERVWRGGILAGLG
jgi:hypothetical protein